MSQIKMTALCLLLTNFALIARSDASRIQKSKEPGKGLEKWIGAFEYYAQLLASDLLSNEQCNGK